MDSMYELPRTAPVPASLEKIHAVPLVPEVSMIFQNNANVDKPSGDSLYLTYNQWKATNQNRVDAGVKHNYLNLPHVDSKRSTACDIPQNISRRQVRFESPVLHQQLKNSSDNITVLSSSCRFPNPFQNSNIKNCDDSNLPVKPNKLMKPFEQLYMANVPNRHLDLSIIDPPRLVVGNKENISPNINVSSNTHDFMKSQSVAPAVTINKNPPHYFKDVINTKKDSMNRDCNFNNDANPQKMDWLASSNKRRENMDCSSQMTEHLNTSGVTAKNHIMDLYNYNRDRLNSLKSDYERRYTLDNVKLADKPGPTETDTLRNHLPSSANVYESFTSHNCGSNKCGCNCVCSKELQGNIKCSTTVQTEVPTNKHRDGSHGEPTVKDLLKIIQQQNDQLLNLQKQVATLLNSKDAPKQIEAPSVPNRNVNLFGEQYQTSTQLETQGLCNAAPKFLPKKGPLQQFSMDVMTSFEVSIRRPQNFNRPRKSAVNHQPKICEITESDSDAFNQSRNSAGSNVRNVLGGLSNKKSGAGDDTFKNNDVSLTFNEPVQVRETCPSPVNSVEIHMNDYSFDSDQEDSSEAAGWTFYNNMMQQVNHILKKSGIQPSNSPPVNINEAPQHPVKGNMMRTVKEATIKHLRSIGVHVPAMDDADDSVENDPFNRIGCNPNEVSFAVKQLLMKYLPDEQLAKLTYMQRENGPVPGKPGLIKRRPEFSFATVQYMQKYNLLNDAPNGYKVMQQPAVVQQNGDFDRILDATAIRQQPKLL